MPGQGFPYYYFLSYYYNMADLIAQVFFLFQIKKFPFSDENRAENGSPGAQEGAFRRRVLIFPRKACIITAIKQAGR